MNNFSYDRKWENVTFEGKKEMLREQQTSISTHKKGLQCFGYAFFLFFSLCFLMYNAKPVV